MMASRSTCTSPDGGVEDPMMGSSYVHLDDEKRQADHSSADARKDLKVLVYREFGFPFCSKAKDDDVDDNDHDDDAESLVISYMDKRPSSCPQAIDLFLWSGLSTSILEACAPLERRKVRLYMLAELIAWIFLITGWYDDYTAVNVNALVYWFCIAPSALVLSFVLAWGGTRHWFRGRNSELHTRVREAIETLRPHLHKVGYDLSYHVRKSWFLPLSWVHITPLYGTSSNSTTGEPPTYPVPITSTTTTSTTTAMNNNNRRRDFRVPVYGRSVFAEGSFTTGRTEALKFYGVDKFTWGAVATELQPLAGKFWQVKWWTNELLKALVALSWIWVMCFPDVPLPFFFVLNGVAIGLTISHIFQGNVLENFILHKILGQEEESVLFSRMQDKIEELSPMVVEQSGYSLVFHTEREGCCSRGAYVCFQLQQQESLSSSNSTITVDGGGSSPAGKQHQQQPLGVMI